MKRELLSDSCTPIQVLRILQNKGKHCFLLESVEKSEHLGRYTILGYNPKLEIVCEQGRIRVRNEEGAITYIEENPISYLNRILAEYTSPRLEEHPPFTGGFVGYFAYDFARYVEPKLRLTEEDEEGFRDMDLMLFDKAIVFDHVKQRILLFVNLDMTKVDTPEEEAEKKRVSRELEELENLILTGQQAPLKPGKLLEPLKPAFGKEAFMAMVEKAKSDANEVEMAYVAGFLCHHALDAIAHPYVNYRTGSATKKTGFAHQLLEAQMDTGLMDYYKLLPSEYNPYKLIRISRKDMECLAHFSHQLLNQVYGFNEEYRVIYECYHDTQSIQHVLSDPKSNKYNIISKLEKLMKIPGMATSMMIPWKYDDKLDAANFRKDTWKHSVTGEEHNESFLEMFNSAVQEAIANLNSLNDFFFADGPLEPILEVMAGRSYDSGIRDGKHKYFKADEE